MNNLEVKCFFLGREKFSVVRVSESAIVVNRGKTYYAGFLRDFRSQLTKVVRRDAVSERMVPVDQDEQIYQYQLNLAMISKIIRNIVQAHG